MLRKFVLFLGVDGMRARRIAYDALRGAGGTGQAARSPARPAKVFYASRERRRRAAPIVNAFSRSFTNAISDR